jgi:hypothetical protein
VTNSSGSQAYKRKKRRNWKRNKRRRETLIAQGMTPEEAQAIIEADGKRQELAWAARERVENEQDREQRRAIRAELNARYPTQPARPQSVRAVPVAFESNRSRH